MKEFKKIIKESLKEKNLSMREVSVDAGLHESALNKILRSDISPRLDTAMKICKVLNIEIFPEKKGIINTHHLEKSIKEVLKKTAKIDMTPAQKAQLIAAFYNDYSEKP